MKNGLLFVVATPIGNLDDLSPRARRVLAEADIIAAEDTRHTRRLLSHFGIKTPLMALHEHNERDMTAALVARLEGGEVIAMVSDAGTPLISDPGYHVVQAARRRGIAVSPVPGPNAAVAALSVAGLPTDRYCFEGFLPARGAARRERLKALRNEPRSLVFYAAVHRIRPVVDDLASVFGGDREAFVGRELTKLHEECVAATLHEVAAALERGELVSRGEFVLIVAGCGTRTPAAEEIDADVLLRELLAVLPGKQAVSIAARVTGGNRNALYRRMLELAKSPPA